MSDLSSFQHKALASLIWRKTNGNWARASGATNYWIRTFIGRDLISGRETRNLMHRLHQVGFVKPVGITVAGAVVSWRMTDAGARAIGLDGRVEDFWVEEDLVDGAHTLEEVLAHG